jgi:hypothetical protein
MKPRTMNIFVWSLLLMLTLTHNALAQFTLSEAKEIAAIPLTVDKAEKMYRIQVALTRQGAGERSNTAGSAADETLEQKVQEFNKTPNAETLCRAEGLSVREYVLIVMAINIAINPINNPAIQPPSGNKAADPMVVADSPEHIKFVQDHQAELEKGAASVYAAYKAATTGQR